ncbi:MAG: intracellular septation protein, partial [Hyphomicrobiales bacterium]|nr:intracellular septation protein [Hyphomicrobiales bacterium]
MPTETKKQLNPLLKLALEMGPLILFFVANSRPALFMPFVAPLLPEAVSGEKAGIFVATAVFMVAILVSLAVSYVLTRHLPVMAMVTAVIVVVFGGLTLVLHDDTFIKMKPTIIYLLFAGLLLGGLAFNKP